ncbi:MAG: hypothetical protein KTV45_07110 [Acidimicrobiia bacterium]|nr:hypothetical protein [Acidimicrobiia bacterium]
MAEKENASGSGGIDWVRVVVFAVFGWGAVLWFQEWWDANEASVWWWAARVGVAAAVGALLFFVLRWRWRRGSARAARGLVGEGWSGGERDVFAVVPGAGSGRGRRL